MLHRKRMRGGKGKQARSADLQNWSKKLIQVSTSVPQRVKDVLCIWYKSVRLPGGKDLILIHRLMAGCYLVTSSKVWSWHVQTVQNKETLSLRLKLFSA